MKRPVVRPKWVWCLYVYLSLFSFTRAFLPCLINLSILYARKKMNNFWRVRKTSRTWKALVECTQLWWYWETGRLCLGTEIQIQRLIFGILEPRNRILMLKHLNQNRKRANRCFRSIVLVSDTSCQKLLPQLCCDPCFSEAWHRKLWVRS